MQNTTCYANKCPFTKSCILDLSLQEFIRNIDQLFQLMKVSNNKLLSYNTFDQRGILHMC